MKTWEISTFSFFQISFFLNCEQDARTIYNTDIARIDMTPQHQPKYSWQTSIELLLKS
ncbi:MAG: hypothetical protein SWX82_23140 [Cyanobacteriota bacterium]|nr:hypothetical protein [Cyanobacteriota bacterium]